MKKNIIMGIINCLFVLISAFIGFKYNYINNQNVVFVLFFGVIANCIGYIDGYTDKEG